MSQEVAISILSPEPRTAFRSICRWNLEGEASVAEWRQTRISIKRQKYVEGCSCDESTIYVLESGCGQYWSFGRRSSEHCNPRVLWFDLIAVNQKAITSWQTMNCMDLSLSQRFEDCRCLSHLGLLTANTKLDVYSIFHMSDRSNDLITIRHREIFKCL